MPPRKIPSKNSIKDAFNRSQSRPIANSSIKEDDNSTDRSKSMELLESLKENKTIDSIQNIIDVKSTLNLMMEVLNSLSNQQIDLKAESSGISKDVNDLTEHVNNQLTNIENDLAAHKNDTDDKLLALKVTADIRHSKYFLKIFARDDKRMKSVTKINAMSEANKILKELNLSINPAKIVGADTRFEKRNLFGPPRFIKLIVLTFNDFVTAEKILIEYLKGKNGNNKNEVNATENDNVNTITSNLLKDKYYLELPSTFEMRKIMSVCKELKKEEGIEKVVFGADNVKAIMKKDNPNDKDEIPKKYEVNCFKQIDNMRKKFKMSDNDIPSKQIYTNDYWQQKRNSETSRKNGKSKRKLEKSYEQDTEAKRDRKDVNSTLINSFNSSLESFKDSEQ